MQRRAAGRTVGPEQLAHTAAVLLGQDKGLEEVGQLPQLRHLELNARDAPEGLLLHVAKLQQLTYLTYTGGLNGESISSDFEQRVSLHGHGMLAQVVPTNMHVSCLYLARFSFEGLCGPGVHCQKSMCITVPALVPASVRLVDGQPEFSCLLCCCCPALCSLLMMSRCCAKS